MRNEPIPARTVAAVSAGGVLGALARYGIGVAWPGPWATVAINLVGCLVMGCVIVAVPERLRPFLATGVLGGFTTFSTYCGDVQHLFATGRSVEGGLYMVLTLVGALAAAALGAAVTRRVVE
nr:CrcB family protein [Actinokineospora enzanensis]